MSKKVYWKQRNGELIDIDDMDINHLRNTLKLVLRNRETVVKQILKSKRTNFMLHGDIATQFNETHLSDEDDDRFEFNDLHESMNIGNNELGHY
jgi:hypothetical protein